MLLDIIGARYLIAVKFTPCSLGQKNNKIKDNTEMDLDELDKFALARRVCGA